MAERKWGQYQILLRARNYPLNLVTRRAEAVSVTWRGKLGRDREMKKKRQYDWKQASASLFSFKTIAEEGALVYPYSEGKGISNYYLNCFSY